MTITLTPSNIEHERKVTIHVTDGPIGTSWDGLDVRLTKIIGTYIEPTTAEPEPYFNVNLEGDGLRKNGTPRRGYKNRFWSDRPEGFVTEHEESIRAEAEALVRKELDV